MNKEEKEAIEYYSNKEISFSCDFNTEELLKALGIEETEKDSFENHQIRFRTLLNLIQKQSKIIDKMAEFLEDELTIDEFCNKENCYADEYINGHCQKCLNCIKEYFKKDVEKM